VTSLHRVRVHAIFRDVLPNRSLFLSMNHTYLYCVGWDVKPYTLTQSPPLGQRCLLWAKIRLPFHILSQPRLLFCCTVPVTQSVTHFFLYIMCFCVLLSSAFVALHSFHLLSDSELVNQSLNHFFHLS